MKKKKYWLDILLKNFRIEIENCDQVIKKSSNRQSEQKKKTKESKRKQTSKATGKITKRKNENEEVFTVVAVGHKKIKLYFYNVL